ncbi:hypothetical protein EOPP23_14730 [Endozoicomonas sp. OPT23]|uniref:UvrD-helicase domain-containing protein n=1 Tax=Endozoicomonas sp. OPT23 TaxID=2072845 RepID=UPI00129B73A7|nr:UvrD-helicase domain-containing protein [Endozoicomonas sp. OPT23]MRI34247.1 hypothetical protein [Endozoicomonas sp. OPT23]
MDQAVLERQLLKLLSLHAPVKARKLASVLADEFGLHVDRSDVNSALYRLKSGEKTSVDSSYQWSLVGHSSPNVSKPKTTESVVVPIEPAQPTITFTPEQQSIIDLDPFQHLLIRGQAGSGKTTVLAARAGRMLSAMNKGSLLFLTYNTALCAYVKNAFQQAGMKGDIDVRTFHDWSRVAAKELGADFVGWINSKSRTEQLKKLIEEGRDELGEHRLYDLKASPHLLGWWSDEIAWLFGQHVTHLNEYLDIERIGRGTAIRVSNEDRRFVWFVFELYQEWLEETQQEDYDNPAGLILRALMEQQATDLPESLRYDHVMVDEVQDFDKSWLLAAVKIPRVSLSLAGDLAQKIYRRSFTWSSVGIQVMGGRSRRLSASHRTTRQIMQVAECLLKDNDVTASSDYTVPVAPRKNGPVVTRVIGSDPRHSYERGYEHIAREFKLMRTTTVAVALPFTRQLYPATKALEKLGVKAKNAKGASLGKFGGGVVVTTYHQLKGLEFDHVVVMGLHDAQYPGRLLEALPEEDRPDEMNLMRRILYVALTRAKQSVTLVGSDPFCRFFDDIPAEFFETVS